MGGRSIGVGGFPLEESEPDNEQEFEWDEAKRQLNITKHGLDFEDAKQVWDGRSKVTVDSPRDSESRQLNIAKIDDKIYSVISTLRGIKIRIISFRSANLREVKLYERLIQQNDG
jgi:uncharacterized DUF497 family protein